MTDIFLVRHGQASFGAATYDALSELGHRQSRELGLALRAQGCAPAAFYTGAMRRHRETLAGIAEGLGHQLEPRVHEGLNEFDFQGLLTAYFRGNVPADLKGDRKRYFQTLRDVVFAWMDDAIGDPPEPFAAFTHRVTAARDAMAAETGPVLATTSGGPIARLITLSVEAPPQQMIRIQFQTKNASVTRLKAADDAVYLAGFNETPHIVAENMADLLTHI